MTQPRSAQIKNPKTKYRGFTRVGNLTLGGTANQKIYNTSLENFYDNFLATTISQKVGGVEEDCPGILFGGTDAFAGPWLISPGAQFSIAIPGVTGGIGVTVTVQAGDVVTLNGAPVVTTARMAARINAAMVGAGVTYPVAQNIDGRLVLFSATAAGLSVGDSASITIADITPGCVSIMGFAIASSATSPGVTSPRDGIVTVSPDSYGGYIQLRNASDSHVSEPTNSAQLHASRWRYVPQYSPGQPVFARVRAFPGAAINGRYLDIRYYRNGWTNPTVVTSQGANKSNFATLSGADQLTTTLNYVDYTVSFVTTFSTPTTVQQVVNQINAAYAAGTLGADGIEATRASVKMGLPGPYRFTNPTTRDSFFVAFNAQSAIQVAPPAGIYTVASFVAFINTQVSNAGQTSQGEAIASGSQIILQSKSTDPTVSSIQILAGNPGGSTPANFMATLDYLALTPGTYRGSAVAFLYGNDEIQFVCPSARSGSSITLSYVALTGARLGLNGTSTIVSSAQGLTLVPVPTQQALIPEVLEFKEEPDNYDTVVQSFDARGDSAEALARDGALNVGLSNLLGQDGKIDPSQLASIFANLNIDRLNLGPRMRENATDQITSPRIEADFNPAAGAYMLLYEGNSLGGVTSANTVRIYVGGGEFLISENAKLNAAGTWQQDNTATVSSKLDFNNGKFSVATYPAAGSSPWADAAWLVASVTDPTSSTAFLELGSGFLAGVNALIARVSADTDLTGSRVLLMELGDPSSTSPKTRFYISTPTINVGTNAMTAQFEITLNARWDGSAWQKDLVATRATRLRYLNAIYDLSVQFADSGWTTWEKLVSQDFFFAEVLPGQGFTHKLTGWLDLGSEIANAATPRLQVNRYVGGGSGNRRTQLFRSQAGANSQASLGIWLNNQNAAFGEGIIFTFNCEWSQAQDRWIRNATGLDAYVWSMSGGVFYLLTNPSDTGMGIWEDSLDPTVGWTYYDQIDGRPSTIGRPGFNTKNGVFTILTPGDPGSFANPNAVDPINVNSLYAKSMIKSWGVAQYSDDPSSFIMLDGFNMQTPFPFFDSGWSVVYSTPLTGSGNPAVFLMPYDGVSLGAGVRPFPGFVDINGFVMLFEGGSGSYIQTVSHLSLSTTT